MSALYDPTAISLKNGTDVVDSDNPLPVDNTLQTSVLSAAVAIADSATVIPTSPLSGRRSITLRNNGSNTLFIGGSGVSTANGYPLKVNETIDIDVSAGLLLYGIVASGTEDLRILEFN